MEDVRLGFSFSFRVVIEAKEVVFRFRCLHLTVMLYHYIMRQIIANNLCMFIMLYLCAWCIFLSLSVGN